MFNSSSSAGNFAFLITGVAIPGGMDRVDVAGYLAAAGIYCHEDDMAYGTDGSDSRNERTVLRVVGHLGDSDHKYNPMALSQLAAAWPASRTVSIELDEIGAYSYSEGGQLMANVNVLPFGGAPSLGVAYVAHGGVHTPPALSDDHHDCDRTGSIRATVVYEAKHTRSRRKPAGGSARHSQWQGYTQPHEALCNGGAGCCAWRALPSQSVCF